MCVCVMETSPCECRLSNFGPRHRTHFAFQQIAAGAKVRLALNHRRMFPELLNLTAIYGNMVSAHE